MDSKLNAKYEVFTFTYNGDIIEAEVCCIDYGDKEDISVSGYYPQNVLIPDNVIIREYYMWKDTTMSEFDNWRNV